MLGGRNTGLFFFFNWDSTVMTHELPNKMFFFSFKTKIVVLKQHLQPSRRDGCFCCREAAIFLFLTISKLLQTREVSPVQFLSLPPPPTSTPTSTSTSTLIFSSPPFPHNKNYVCLTFVGYTQTLLSAFFKKLIFICPLFQLIVISKFIAILLVKSV